jgi:predicted transcriptional regulator
MENKPEGGMLTAAEAEIMTVVWQIGSAAVQDIVERIPRDLAYTTVMTTVRILEEKGFLWQAGKRGRAFLYEAAIDRESASESMTHEVARRLFGGSMKSLVLNLVRDDAISGDDLAEVKRIIEQLESKQ